MVFAWPCFHLEIELLTLMYIASFRSIRRFWSFLPTITEVFPCSCMTCGVKMVIYWRKGFQMFFEPVPKFSSGFFNIFFIIFHPVIFESIDDATLLGYRIFLFGCHQEVFEGFAPLWSTLVYHVFCKQFLCFYSGLLYMVPLFSIFSWSSWNCYLLVYWYSCCFLLDGLEHWYCYVSCSRPMLDIYIWSGLFGDVLVVTVPAVWWSIQL